MWCDVYLKPKPILYTSQVIMLRSSFSVNKISTNFDSEREDEEREREIWEARESKNITTQHTEWMWIEWNELKLYMLFAGLVSMHMQTSAIVAVRLRFICKNISLLRLRRCFFFFFFFFSFFLYFSIT